MGSELVIALTAVIGALALVSCQAQAVNTSMDSMRDQVVSKIVNNRIDSILNRMEYNVETIDEDASVIEMHAQNVVLIKYESSLQLNASFEAVVELERINRWNAETRYANAYLDSEGDPVMELDLDLTGGVTVARIEDYFRTYEVLLVNFIIEVLSNGEDDNDGGGICEPVDDIEGSLIPA